MSPIRNPLPGVPVVESPFRERLLADTAFEVKRVARDLAEHGFSILDFPEPEMDQISLAIRANLEHRFDWNHWHEVGCANGEGMRIQDAWQFDPHVRRLASNPHMLNLLSAAYGRQAWPFQTLNFPVGSQQHFHADTVHFNSVPERFMCGVWVALEDVSECQGPLVFYPGSHKWPIYGNEHIEAFSLDNSESVGQHSYEAVWEALVEVHAVKPEIFTPRKGQAIIWAANLLHGGMPHQDPGRTRWSQVTHYYFENCAYYTPIQSHWARGSVAFRSLINIADGRPVPSAYAGRPIPDKIVQMLRPRVLDLPDGFDPERYLDANPDVKASGMNAQRHWIEHGQFEGRALRR